MSDQLQEPLIGGEEQSKPIHFKSLLTLAGLTQMVQIIGGLLVCISAFSYAFGYISWATYAKINGLGYLPAVREQYFIAGLIPLMIFFFILLLVVVYFLFPLGDSWGRARVIDKQKPLLVVSLGAIMLLVVFYIVFHLLGFNVSYWLYVLVFGMLLLPVPLIFYTINKSTGFWIFKGYVPIAITICCLTLYYSLYVGTIFPQIPRAFGGPKTSSITMDVKRDELSVSTILLLTGNKTPVDTNKVIRTASLFLVFDEGDFILFKQKEGPIEKGNALIRIKRDLICSILNTTPINGGR